MGVISGPFGANLSPFKAKLQAIEANMGLISLLFWTQNGLNPPKLCTVAPTINIQNLWEALGANFGGIWYNWEAIWSPFWAHLQAQ